MKKIAIYINIALLLLSFTYLPGFSQNRVYEKIYISTDRNSYVAGEDIWLSAYCFNVADSLRFTGISSIAYIELHNSTSMVLSAKIALINGRGSGNITLPPNLPTGNYRLVAYTKHILNNPNPPLFEKILSIYNVLAKDRVEGNVVYKKEETVKADIGSGDSGIKLSQLGSAPLIGVRFGESGKIVNSNSSFPVTIENSGENLIYANVSVFKIDSLLSKQSSSIVGYFQPVKSGSLNLLNKFIPEYEGEIISGRVITNSNTSLTDRLIYLSATGNGSDVYTSYIDSLGCFRFFTNSILGDREVVLQVPSIDSTGMISYELDDPFIKFKGDSIPKLILKPDINGSLVERSIGMQIGRRFGSDTLFDMLPFRNDPLIGKLPVIYKLDDYTRFTVMPEVMIEYIPELRFRKFNGNNDLQVRIEEGYNLYAFSKGNSLVLLDGIPVFDHSKIYNYDPLKVKSISIYCNQYNIGLASYDGIAMFNTYKGDYQGLTLNKNVRILDFKGVLHPSAMTASKVLNLSNYPDMRSLLYWNPAINLSPGESSKLFIHTSSLTGKFGVVIEGFTGKGVPIEYYTEFTVK